MRSYIISYASSYRNQCPFYKKDLASKHIEKALCEEMYLHYRVQELKIQLPFRRLFYRTKRIQLFLIGHETVTIKC